MPAKPQPVPPAPTARTETPVRVFSVGQVLPSGRVADEPFLDAVVANWEAYQAKGDPRLPKPPAYLIPAASVGIGHTNDQQLARAYAERSDLPAVGWPAGRLWRDGRFLMAERFEGVPVKLAEWVNAKAYRTCSAEFYENYQGLGPVLRRVSLLGADIPACKDLGDLPTLVFDPEAIPQPNPVAFTEALAAFAGKHRGRFGVTLGPGPGHLVTFSESTPAPPRTAAMNPQQKALYDALAALGVDVSKLDGAALDGILKACTPAPANPATTSPPATNNDQTDPTKMAAMFSELAGKAVTAAVKPLQDKIDALESSNKATAATLAASKAAADRATIAQFCETHKDKIFPFELDAELAKQKGTVTLIDQLLAQSADVVATFAEGKVSPRAAMMATIAARLPVAKFAERIAQPITPTDPKAEVNRLLALTPTGRGALPAQPK